MSEMAPTVPGKTRPGFQSSTTIPIRPIESISVIRFGSTRKSRARCQKLISTSSIWAPAVSRTNPFGTVFVPSIRSSNAGSVGATNSTRPIRFASRAP